MSTIDLETYKAIFDMIPVGLGIAALNGKLLIFNKAILEPGGYTEKDIEAFNSVVELYYDPADRAVAMGMAQKDGFLNNFRVRFKKKNGDPYYTLMSLRPVKFQNQSGWLATVLDIDDQVKAEESLNGKVEELQKLNRFMIDREMKIVELKRRLGELN